MLNSPFLIRACFHPLLLGLGVSLRSAILRLFPEHLLPGPVLLGHPEWEGGCVASSKVPAVEPWKKRPKHPTWLISLPKLKVFFILSLILGAGGSLSFCQGSCFLQPVQLFFQPVQLLSVLTQLLLQDWTCFFLCLLLSLGSEPSSRSH